MRHFLEKYVDQTVKKIKYLVKYNILIKFIETCCREIVIFTWSWIIFETYCIFYLRLSAMSDFPFVPVRFKRSGLKNDYDFIWNLSLVSFSWFVFEEILNALITFLWLVNYILHIRFLYSIRNFNFQNYRYLNIH